LTLQDDKLAMSSRIQVFLGPQAFVLELFFSPFPW